MTAARPLLLLAFALSACGRSERIDIFEAKVGPVTRDFHLSLLSRDEAVAIELSIPRADFAIVGEHAGALTFVLFRCDGRAGAEHEAELYFEDQPVWVEPSLILGLSGAVSEGPHLQLTALVPRRVLEKDRLNCGRLFVDSWLPFQLAAASRRVVLPGRPS